MTFIFTFLLAGLSSATLVPIGRIAARRLGYLATPNAAPSTLGAKVPLGGIAIALTLFSCAAAVGAIKEVGVLLIASGLLFLVGLATDLFRLKPLAKLIGVIVVASVFLFLDYRLMWSDSLTLDGILTLFWIVGITSAFNLLDSMDGLCGGIALIAGAAFLMTVLPVAGGGPLASQIQYLAVLLGAIAGFLIYNVYPASVRMGDAGSLVIGINMAAMTLQIAAGRGSNLISVIAVPVLLLLIPVGDAMLAAVSRLTSAPAWGAAATDSSPHRLVAIGLSHRSAVQLLWLLAATSGGIAIIADRNPEISGLLAAMFTIAMALFAVYLARVRVHENVDAHMLPTTITPLGVHHGYRRRFAEMLLDMLLVSVAYYGAFRLLLTGAEWAENFEQFRQSFPIVLSAQMLALFGVGAYRGMWRYFGLSDGVTFAKGVLIGVLASQVGLVYFYRFDSRSPALFIVYAMLLLLLLVGSRASFRLISEFAQRQRHTGRRLVIYGAGDAGSLAARHLLNDQRSAYRIVGFIDDDVSMRNIRVHGYRVIGGYDHLVGLVLAGQVDCVAVTHEIAGLHDLASLCGHHRVPLYRLAIDWHEIPAPDPRAAAVAGRRPAPDARVVQFTDARRERSVSASLEFRGFAAAEEERTQADGSISASPQPAPIRVLHVITRLILGGAQENTLYTVIGQHQDPRFDVTLLCGIDEAGEGNMFAQANRAGIKAVVQPSLLREIRPLTDFVAVVQLYRFLKQGSFAIVHTHSSKAGIIGRIAARAAGVPVVVHTLHGLAFHEFQSIWKNWLYIALERLCAPMTDKILSVSDTVSKAALARRIGGTEQHMTVYSGIELDLFLSVREQCTVEEAKEQAGIPPNAPVVGKIARLFPLKGHEQFMAAAAVIAREVPETYFLLVGDGPLREELRAEATRLGLADRVVMVGRVPPDMVPSYIQAMDVVVHTSLREGIARVLPQAGAVGKPVVTFDLDGAPEVIRSGVSGYLVAPLDTDQIAHRTVELLRDPEKRRIFGEAGRAFATEHFSVERMVDRINAVYLDLYRRHSPASAPQQPSGTVQ